MRFQEFEVLTFDCYGTLIDWESGILHAIRPVLARHGVSLPDEELLVRYGQFEPTHQQAEPFRPYKEILQRVMDDMAQSVGITLTSGERMALVESLPQWKPFPDTVEALKLLKSRYSLAIISNIDEDLIAQTLRHLEVSFDWVIAAEQVKSYKPSLNNFLQAIERIGKPREAILHVAQSLHHDIAPARELGLSTVWVNRRHDKPGFGATKPSDAQPDLAVPDLISLAKQIESAVPV